MQLEDARRLIEHKALHLYSPQVWVDLGCGSGVFTLALASLLPAESKIYAVDSNKALLNKIPAVYNNVTVETFPLDFAESPFPFNKIDGVLMANSLHYVKDKAFFIHKIKNHLHDKHQILIVEYDTDKPVKTWVPYPLSFNSLKKLFEEAGYASVTKLHQRPSVFGSIMYSALISSL